MATQGHPLELEAVKAFRRAGLESVVSYHYRADSESPTREIDIFAWRRQMSGAAEVNASFLVEAKSTTDKPWVLLLDQPEESAVPRRVRHHFTLKSRYAGAFLRASFRRKPMLERAFLFSTPQRLAYGLRTAFSKSDFAYQAVQSCLAASLAQLGPAHHVDSDFPLASFVFPVILIDAPLLQYWLDKNDEPQVAEVADSTLFWPSATDGRPVLVEVVTRVGLPQWLERVSASLALLMDDCEPELDMIAQRWEKEFNK